MPVTFSREHALVAMVALTVLVATQLPEAAAPPQTVSGARPCRVTGFVRSGEVALPGAAVSVREGERTIARTSTDIDGSYVLAVSPGTYTLEVGLSVFASAERVLAVSSPPCDQQIVIDLTLASRTPGAPSPVSLVSTPAPDSLATGAAPALNAPGRGSAAALGGAAGRGGRQGGPPRFQSLSVQSAAPVETTGEDVLLTTESTGDDPASRLLPPGFSINAAPESIAVSGSMIEVDRGQMNDRLQALGRGEFGLADGQQFGPGGEAQPGGVTLADAGGRGGLGGPPGGGGGRGGILGGRGGGNRFQMQASYNLGGSMFDSAPHSLRPDQPSTERDYLQQSFTTTFGGPVKLPGIYDGTNRTNFNFTYSGGRNGDMFDQYATVPSAAFKAGDFSSSTTPIIDPLTGNAFEGNRIPADRMSRSALTLLEFFPDANLPGNTRNFHLTDTTASTTDQFQLRITHSLTAPQAGRGRAGGAAGGGGAAGRAGPGAAAGGGGAQGRGGAGGRGGRGAFQPPLNITMNATINYRRNDGDRLNVYPMLSGRTKGSTLSIPFSMNIRNGRWMHTIGTSFSRTASATLNTFAYRQDIAALAGITGVATDPFDWGVPSLTFGTYTTLRDTAPSRRRDRSWGANYSVARAFGLHNVRFGGSYQSSLNWTQSDSNARGTFTFTGLYTAYGLSTIRGSGQDFADFLLGLPQQATRQYSGALEHISVPVGISGRQMSAFFADDWRIRARWTVNYGIQYDFIAPFTETSGRMVNLDVAPDFSDVVPVEAGDTGPYSGEFPMGLVRGDWNNVAPRVGVAWRATNRSVVRFGYGLSYNTGSYSTIARNLYQQPPYFQTGTSQGTLEGPLLITDAFSNIAPSTVTNNYGIIPDYQLGLIHQWNVDYSRDVSRVINVGGTYIGTRGANLDLLRAPNRGPDGLRLPDVQSYTWQSDEGSSHMNGLSLRVMKRQSHGFSAQASYTLSRSWDNTTATGGSPTVAQDDRNLDAEWGLSNFDRRHQLSASANVALPWGRNRKWLNQGGWLAFVAGDWSAAATMTAQSGSPLTARCSTCASDVARGVGGTLRADYLGGDISVSNPTIDRFFNTAAFALPAAGTFGNSARNMITGPGSRTLNAQFTRDVALGGNRSVSVNVNATNLLNLANYGTVDTNVNSPTFGQVLSVRGQRSVRLNLRFRF
jgi:hypothetical protein